MKVLILPYLSSKKIGDVYKTINEDSMQVHVEQSKRKNQVALASYGVSKNKITITDESGINNDDLKKEMKNAFEFMGNGITSCSINGKPCTFIVFYKGSDLSKPNIEKIIGIIRQHNLRLEHG